MKAIDLALLAFFLNYNEYCSLAQLTDNIHKCVSWGDPHTQRWHSTLESGPDYKDCLSSGLYELVSNSFMTFYISIERYYVVDILITFYDGITIDPLCVIGSTDFQVGSSRDCAENGVNVQITQLETFRTISIYYQIANFTAIITHNSHGNWPHYNINVWHSTSMINETIGICKSDSCESERHHREQQGSTDDRKITVEIACMVCEIYMKNYLAKISRAYWQHSEHYNKTINNVREACAFDIQRTGILETAASGMEVLMVEELTTEAEDLASIQLKFEAGLKAAVAKLNEAIIKSETESQELLSQTTTTTSVMSSSDKSTSKEILNTTALSTTGSITGTMTSCITSMTSTSSPNLSAVSSKHNAEVSYLLLTLLSICISFPNL
ncbi:unnamed protein product [Adineta steineri]|uniref:Uncharacterized protein n=1 Tax=Adineta steineri TaxID=433720 RepID=A0A815BXF3_9BILA|nr:unnamed protein product [Adineta steineri]CAF1373227.1 unnamed protein product [Adineta steineri]CAF3587135.1 unnamed protein product [Adineta steineri]CAF3892794.1 unnamed protein product [Adineta steineri]